MNRTEQRVIEVWVDWSGLGQPTLMGILYATPGRSKEIFSFEYDTQWLRSGLAQNLDPSLQLYTGPQYSSSQKANFGVFLDSSPDRWGRTLMDRREAQLSKLEGRASRRLHESDYLLGVYDRHRMGALRFRLEPDGPFLDNNEKFATPPWTSLRDLEYASLQIERDGAEKQRDYDLWLQMLIAPGGSLGGARPKASVLDEEKHLWIAKFPSRKDTHDLGAWEYLAYQLARRSGVAMADCMIRRFNSDYHTFLTKRFDRDDAGRRLHFASAMTLLGRKDGDDAAEDVSYLEIAELIMQIGARPNQDLEQLWRRIVFSICISNTDDHLRNHGFLLEPNGWVLSPAFDINPTSYSYGLKLNISQTDNALDLDLAMEVSNDFRVKKPIAQAIIDDCVSVVKEWRSAAQALHILGAEQDRMADAFRVRK